MTLPFLNSQMMIKCFAPQSRPEVSQADLAAQISGVLFCSAKLHVSDGKKLQSSVIGVGKIALDSPFLEFADLARGRVLIWFL